MLNRPVFTFSFYASWFSTLLIRFLRKKIRLAYWATAFAPLSSLPLGLLRCLVYIVSHRLCTIPGVHLRRLPLGVRYHLRLCPLGAVYCLCTNIWFHPSRSRPATRYRLRLCLLDVAYRLCTNLGVCPFVHRSGRLTVVVLVTLQRLLTGFPPFLGPIHVDHRREYVTVRALVFPVRLPSFHHSLVPSAQIIAGSTLPSASLSSRCSLPSLYHFLVPSARITAGSTLPSASLSSR